MGKELKSRTAAGYDIDVTLACERTLLTLLSAFGSLKDTLRLVGGLVPRYLPPEAPPDVPLHAGTSDVDVVLNLEVLAPGNEYTRLADQLKARGFVRWVEDGKAASWRWRRRVDEHLEGTSKNVGEAASARQKQAKKRSLRVVNEHSEPVFNAAMATQVVFRGALEVVVEFLRDAGDEAPGKPVNVSAESVSALTIKHARIVHDWYQEREVAAHLLDGGGLSIDTVRFADVPAFVILKAIALDQRQENKDAADLIHVIRYAGSIKTVASLFIERIHSGQHQDAIQDGLTALARRFCDDRHGEGYEKTGAVAYARFIGSSDEDQQIALQRYAAGLIQALLDEIEAQRQKAQPFS